MCKLFIQNSQFTQIRSSCSECAAWLAASKLVDGPFGVLLDGSDAHLDSIYDDGDPNWVDELISDDLDLVEDSGDEDWSSDDRDEWGDYVTLDEDTLFNPVYSKEPLRSRLRMARSQQPSSPSSSAPASIFAWLGLVAAFAIT